MNGDDPLDYSIYGQRLRTFNDKNWPADSDVYIKELVEAGFVYTGEIDLVFCFKCGITESNWQDNDDPLTRHSEANPYCPYILKKKKKTNTEDQTEDKCSNDRTLKSLEDYERESFIYDWIPGKGVVQRNNIPNDDTIKIEPNVNTEVHPENGLEEQESTPVINLRLANEDMRFESKRYQSYGFCSPNKHWPSPEKLSAAGFYYVDDKIGMKCFCCNAVIEGWESAEQCPLKKHRSLSPSCAFARGIFCGNIPRGQEDVCDSLLTRIKNIQPPVKSNLNRPSGHYPITNRDDYLGLDDEPLLSCPFVPREGIYEPVNKIDVDVGNIHQQNSGQFHQTPPPRKMVNTTERTPNGHNDYFHEHPRHYHQNFHEPRLMNPTVPSQISPLSYQLHQRIQVEPALGVAPLSPNSNSEFSDESKRMKTFFTWPRESPIQPLDLARAGFVYDGKGDLVRCYVCNISLCGWTRNDDVWLDHQKASPKCPFVQKHYNTVQQRSPVFLHEDPVYPPFNNSFRYPPNHRTLNNTGELPNNVQQSPYGHFNGSLPRNPICSPTHPILRTPHGLVGESRNLGPSGPSYTRPIHGSHSPEIPFNSKPQLDMASEYRLPPYERVDSDNDSIMEKIRQVKLTDQKDQNDRIERMVAPIIAENPLKGDLNDSKNKTDNIRSSNVGIGPERKPQIILSSDEVKKLHERNLQRAIQFAETTGTPRKNDEIDRSCKICMVNDVAVTFVPCGHLAVCESCGYGMTVCPICRKTITNTVRTYWI